MLKKKINWNCIWQVAVIMIYFQLGVYHEIQDRLQDLAYFDNVMTCRIPAFPYMNSYLSNSKEVGIKVI